MNSSCTSENLEADVEGFGGFREAFCYRRLASEELQRRKAKKYNKVQEVFLVVYLDDADLLTEHPRWPFRFL